MQPAYSEMVLKPETGRVVTCAVRYTVIGLTLGLICVAAAGLLVIIP